MSAKLPVIELSYYNRVCECCGGLNTEKLWHFEHLARTRSGFHAFRMGNVICRNCGFVFVQHSPTQESLVSYYGDTFPLGSSSVPEYHTQRRLDLVRRYAPANGLIVDLGGSREDEFHRVLKQEGKTVVRMDLKSHESPDVSDTEAIRDGTVDVLTHNFVLEHVPGIREFLGNCHRLIRENGVMIIEVPDLRSYPVDWLGILPHEHVNHFSPGCLSRIADACGFDVLEASQKISSRAPIGFAVVCRKRDESESIPTVVSEYAENKQCFLAGVEHVRAHEEKLRRIHADAQKALAAGERVLLWCANDQMHRMLQLCGPLSGDWRIVDSDPRRRDYLQDVEAHTPAESADFIRGANRILIFSDLNAKAIRRDIEEKFGKRFDDQQVTLLGIYPPN